jgi:hypothetical protein
LKKPPPKKERRFFKFQKDNTMETFTNTIQLEELDTLARLLLRDVIFSGSEERGVATALAVEAGKLTLKGAMLQDPAIRAATTLAPTSMQSVA